MFKRLNLYILMICLASLSQSCLVITAGAAGGSYAWFNGRVEEKLYHDKEHAYDIAKAYLGTEGAEITSDDQANYRLEGKLQKEKDGKINTYKMSFIFKDYEAYKPKDLSTMTKYQKEKMEKEKGLKTLLIFQYTDGIKPQLDESKAQLNAYLNLLN
ncbi:hypothetical protein PQO01_02700 [Lentisphaera marina]|uniref:DUF3568 family protein n=1 Tax=Lentisphaera marina TaxID=1111041 RepID=UPI002366328B|nr:DUF3568 family protein [Lentisphaera marina]MDD7983857.1 hypothetical protein [Lentisphaera marina]